MQTTKVRKLLYIQETSTSQIIFLIFPFILKDREDVRRISCVEIRIVKLIKMIKMYHFVNSKLSAMPYLCTHTHNSTAQLSKGVYSLNTKTTNRVLAKLNSEFSRVVFSEFYWTGVLKIEEASPRLIKSVEHEVQNDVMSFEESLCAHTHTNRL